jgi:hypothetical protein
MMIWLEIILSSKVECTLIFYRSLLDILVTYHLVIRTPAAVTYAILSKKAYEKGGDGKRWGCTKGKMEEGIGERR